MKGDMCLSRVLRRREGAEMDERAAGLGFVMKFHGKKMSGKGNVV